MHSPYVTTLPQTYFTEEQKAQARENIDVQKSLTAGDNIQINGSTISATDTKYTAGTNIQISQQNVISATDTKYTAGNGLNLNGTEFSADTTVLQPKLTAGDNVQINNNVISATDTKYTAGTNVQINSSNVISATDTKYTAGNGLSLTGTEFAVDTSVVQEKLTAGSNVQINGNTISATDTKYTAGSNVQISSGNVISATDTKYTAGTNVQINSSNQISATDTTYSAGSGLTLTGTTFAADKTVMQEKLTAGSNVQINNNVISATDTTYSAGANISIDANNVIRATDTTYTAGDGISINQYDNNKITWVKPTGFAEATSLWFEHAGDFPFMGWTITDNGQAGVKSHGYPQIYISSKNNMTEAPSPGPGGGVGYVILNPGVWQINYAIPFYTDVAGTDGGVASINCYATAKDMVTEVAPHVAYNHINVNRNIADITYWVEMNFMVRAEHETQVYFDAEIIQNGSSDGLAIKLRRGPFNAVQIR